jgi:ABC-type sugar transport system permease subunit
MYIFQQAFESNALGYASALAVALIIVAYIQMRMLRAGESDLA